MNTKEIQRLRKKFIIISMISVFLVMLFIGGVINFVVLTVTRRAIRSTVYSIAARNGEISEMNEPEENMGKENGMMGFPSFAEAFSPDFKHNHFFVIKYSAGNIFAGIVSNTESSSERVDAKDAGAKILTGSKDFGRYGSYYYKRDAADDGSVTLTLLDCSNELATIMRVLIATGATCLFAFIVTLVLVVVFSKKAIRPEIENSLRQKQFITNASHELKTPLAVIRANTELLELTYGENEWTSSTLGQIDHMNGLIQNLVMITKAEERENRSVLSEINASEAVEQTVKPYEAVARQAEKELITEIEPEVKVKADESKIRQLAPILIDNAIKYCDGKGTIKVSLSPVKKDRSGIRLTVSNTFAEGANVDCARFTDRFYREDKSHNIDKGGYGIGLSIAESICKSYGGSIKANWKDGTIYFICQIS